MSPLLLLPLTPRFIALTLAILSTVGFAIALALDQQSILLATGFSVALFLTIVGTIDLFQTSHSVLRNYPILAHFRFIFEGIRPELRQYFFEGDKDGMPFSRDRRAVAYQRAKMALDVRPFGTHYDVYSDGYEWMAHSIAPRPVAKESFRIMIGDADCTQPYSMSVFNISAMSFGSLSANAIRALNGGAKKGGFAHDTGEGGYSPHHRENGGDIIWELGSGYFGARHPDGTFSPEKFAEVAADPQVKMIELKLSQGAKPGHGGVLPAPKVSREISLTRGVPMGEDCISPASHSAFTTPISASRCARASTSCTTPWSASARAGASSWVSPARSSPAASSRNPATPAAARPASPPRTRPDSARWSCRTRSSGSPTSTARPCTSWLK